MVGYMLKGSPKSPVQESVQVIDAFEGAFEDEEKARELKRFITHLVAPLKDGAVYVWYFGDGETCCVKYQTYP